MIRVAILTTDSREHYRDYANPRPHFGTAPEALLQGFTKLPEIEVHVVSCLRKPVSSPEKLAANIWYHGLHVPQIGWMKTAYLGCVRAVRKKLKEIRPDIVHGQGTERDCAISAVFSGFSNVLTIHGNMVELARARNARVGSFHWLASCLETFALKRTSGVFCNSIHTEKLVKPRTSKTWSVPNPLRAEFFEKSLPPRRTEQCILLNVGVISANKQQLELLFLAERLHRAGLQFEICFIGYTSTTDPYAAEFLRRVAAAEKEGFARYLGLLTLDDLIVSFDQSSSLIHVPVAEAFGLVVAESLSRNLKFFGSRVGGIPDIVADVDGAELFAPNDWDGLGAAISQWIASGKPQPKCSSELMRQRYHPKEIAQRHVEIYQEVLNK